MAFEPMGGGKYPLIPLRNMLHCVFRGEDGHMGISPQTTTVEDEVWILAGLRRPALLRRRKGDSARDITREAPRYEFIGILYVHGIMDGEAVSDDAEWQNIVLE